jgi:glutamate/aspartate transport system substrate-binding protein
LIVATKFVGKRARNLRTLADPKVKTVVCTAGTNTLARANEPKQRRALGLRIVTGNDQAESLPMVQPEGAAALDDILLAGSVANSQRPDDYAIDTEVFSIDRYTLMLPRGDDAFKRVVDVGVGRRSTVQKARV